MGELPCPAMSVEDSLKFRWFASIISRPPSGLSWILQASYSIREPALFRRSFGLCPKLLRTSQKAHIPSFASPANRHLQAPTCV